MTPEKFIAKWKASLLKERSASQSHFNDLCVLLGVETPVEADPEGEWYCFERGASKTAGGEGWADVWRRGHFGWEYKGKRKNLEAAFAQLQQYAVALENPPLLVVSDMDRIIVHTNWTNTISEVHEITLEDLLDPYKRELLRWVFYEPDRLKPAKTVDALTRDAANKFARLAITLRERGHDPQAVAHFVNRLVFCMFAEDINMLPRRMFSQVVDRAFMRPDIAEALFSQLFTAMKDGGLFGVDEIEWFNGGLFDSATALPLTRDDLRIVGEAAGLNWSDIDPSIFGTLFERGLDPSKRSQLGAHYTDPEKIMMIVRPVIIEPLLREWEWVKAAMGKARTSEKKKKELFGRFLERLKSFRVLDPACGSGNFLYLALLSLKDLEHRVNLEAEAMGLGRQFPSVGPEAVKGIEINPYAAELARVTVWIGEIQWMRKHGFDLNRKPILKPLQTIECRDAILNAAGNEAEWPEADVVIGNPPFLGSRKILPELGHEYVKMLRKIYRKSVPKGADLVCYWFAKACKAINENRSFRVGLVSTNSISGGASREVLEPISQEGKLSHVWRDEPWTVEGAAVRVALICFSYEHAKHALLDGNSVRLIYSNLRAQNNIDSGDFNRARKMSENKRVSFQGVVPRSTVKKSVAVKFGLPEADFAISGEQARRMLLLPMNPNGRPNNDVVVPYLVGDDITTRPLGRFIVDFQMMSEDEAALYEAPFKHIQLVKCHRKHMAQPEALEKWWKHWRIRPDMRQALSPLSRFIVTPRVAKYRIFVWAKPPTLPDNAVVVIARDNDTTFGILHSRFHEAWALRLCTFLGVGNDPRYTPSTTLETFPFPDGLMPNIPAADYAADPRAQAIARAAARLDALRRNWLNPPDLVERIPDVVSGYPDRVLPVDDKAAAELRKRTLTNLYNQRPAWLANVHRELDEAVAVAYGWPSDLSDEEILERLFNLNQERAASSVSVSTSSHSL